MHELSIALGIVDAAVEESDRRDGAFVMQVHLRVGQLSGVVRQALMSCYEMAGEASGVAGARLGIEEVPVTAFFPTCLAARPVVSPSDIRCRECGTPTPQIVTGREL